jgi:hypothetical protein
MYPEQDTAAEKIAEPQAFIVLEQCAKELSRLEGKLSPVMSSGNEAKLAGATPSMSELDARLQSLLGRIREISSRVKI